MMRKLFLLVFSLFIFISTQAQFEFGIKGGVTIAHMNLDIPLEFSNSPNFGGHAAVFFVIGEDDTTRNFTNIIPC